MASAWIQHVLKVKKEKNLSFKDALKQAAKTYKSSNNSKDRKGTRKKRKTRGNKKKRRCRSR